MILTVDDFDAFHVAVHGKNADGTDKRPFDWQGRLLRQVVRDRRWPEVLDLPTGSGKTTCIDIALFALALDAQERDPTNRDGGGSSGCGRPGGRARPQAPAQTF